METFKAEIKEKHAIKLAELIPGLNSTIDGCQKLVWLSLLHHERAIDLVVVNGEWVVQVNDPQLTTVATSDSKIGIKKPVKKEITVVTCGGQCGNEHVRLFKSLGEGLRFWEKQGNGARIMTAELEDDDLRRLDA